MSLFGNAIASLVIARFCLKLGPNLSPKMQFATTPTQYHVVKTQNGLYAKTSGAVTKDDGQ